MDESRPGHPPRLPLIIERPDLAHPFRRTVALVLTAVAWCVWLGMWMVLIATIGAKLGFDFPEIALPSAVSLKSLEALAHIAPYALAAAVAAVVFAYLYDRLRRRLGKEDQRWRPVGIERLARDSALDPQRIAQWQKMQILYVEHGPRGRVTEVHAMPPEAEPRT
jgi:poly-beta-1,6-N-acetyl-D-glucosamine biosynthesis protein PgaD